MNFLHSLENKNNKILFGLYLGFGATNRNLYSDFIWISQILTSTQVHFVSVAFG